MCNLYCSQKQLLLSNWCGVYFVFLRNLGIFKLKGKCAKSMRVSYASLKPEGGGFSFDRMQAGWSMPSQLHSKFCVVLLPGSPGMLWKRKKTWAYDVPGEMRSYNLTLELVFWVSFPMVIFILEWNERAHAFISVLSRLKHYDPLWSNATEEQSSATSAGWFLSLLPIRPALL